MANNLLNDRFSYYGDSPTHTHMRLCTYGAGGMEITSSCDPEEILKAVGGGDKPSAEDRRQWELSDSDIAQIRDGRHDV